MRLVLHVEGASAVELARGIVAAEAVFQRANVDAQTAATGRFKRTRWKMQNFAKGAKPDEKFLRAAEVMSEAEQAAVNACCAGWPSSQIGRRLLEVRRCETCIAEQVRDEVKCWIDTATRPQMWHVIQHGGLRARIFLVDGWPQASVDLADNQSSLAKFGLLDEISLLKLARRSGAPFAAASDRILQAWFANSEGDIVVPWRYLDDQIDESEDLFESIADEWERGIGH